MRISLITPVLNEVNFIRAWIEQGLSWADEILIMDCGSQDGTLDILNDYPRVRTFKTYVPEPFLWDEGKIRNKLIEEATGDYICNLDADELWGSDFFAALPMLRKSHALFHRFVQMPFYYAPQLIRVNQIKLGTNWWHRFYPSTQIRLFRKDGIRYREMGNHAYLEYRRGGKLSARWRCQTHKDIPFFHYHHTIDANKGPRENRAEDLKRSGVRLETYWGPHPSATKFYPWWKDKSLE